MGRNVADRVEEFFDRRARRFDRIYQETPLLERTLNRLLRRGIYERSKVLLREIQRLGAPTLLDVGSGSGVNSFAALDAGASSALGLDFAPGMVALARERAAREAFGERCRFEQADFMTWPSGESFDVVAALGVFDYVEDAPAFFAKMAHHARRAVIGAFPGHGARALVRKVRYRLVLRCPLFLYREADVRSWAEAAGLRELDVAYRSSSGFVAVARRP